VCLMERLMVCLMVYLMERQMVCLMVYLMDLLMGL
jgi:hypothetical protein